MKNYCKIIILSLVSTVSALHAQDFDNYQTVTSQGSIPKEFLTPSSQKYQKEIKQISSKAKNKEKKTRKKFALETNFVLDDMLQSGLVIFNDNITAYLNEVVKTLLPTSEPKLAKLKVYTLRTPAVNAFATSRGEVFVTLGLLAQMENEAQLAFVLAHELTHIEEEHSIEFYLEANGVKTASSKDVLKSGRVNNKLLSKHNYKKEQESEADEKGLTRFLKTKYSVKSIKDVFDVLKYAYLPFDDEAFDYSIFQNSQYLIPTEYKLEKIKPIAGEKDDKDDSESSHPNIAKRKEALNKALSGVSDAGKLEYVVSKERFQLTQKIARFELPQLYLKSEEYSKAIYTTYLLLKKFPNSTYLKKCMAKGLYYQAKYKNDENYSYTSNYSDVEGESQQVYYLMDKIKDAEMAVLAMRYAWQLFAKMPKDSELKTITDDLATILAAKKNALKDFYNLSDIKVDTTKKAVVAQSENAEKTKLDKIRSQNKTDGKEENNEYWRYGFAEFKDSKDFVKSMEEGVKVNKENEETAEYYKTRKGQKAWASYQRNREKNGVQLGIDKIVVINPSYKRIDVRKEIETDYIGTENGQVNYQKIINEIAPKSSLKVEVLDIANLNDKQVNQLNDIRFLNDWFSEQVDKYNLSLTPGSQQAIVDSIAKKHGTDYFLWTGVVSAHENNNAAWAYVGLSVLYPPFLIYTLPYALQPNYEMLYYAILYDVKTGKREVINYEYFKNRDSDSMIKAHLYDTFTQIKAKGKEEKKGKKSKKE
jgi:beta-barrel assembly-enhancing protease